MKYLPTHVLLDLAEDLGALSEQYLGPKNSLVSVRKLKEIDTELLSRIPEGEFVTVYGYKPSGQGYTVITVVGFEPEFPAEWDSDTNLWDDYGFTTYSFT